MHYPDEASELFQQVLKLDPGNKQARTCYNVAKKEIVEYRIREKKIYGKFMIFHILLLRTCNLYLLLRSIVNCEECSMSSV